MKIYKLLFVLVVFSFSSMGCSKDEAAPTQNNDTPEDYEGYTLVWSDDFEGAAIDLTKWEHEVNAGGGGNNELQYYTARTENSFVQDGMLHIVAQQEEYTSNGETRYYTSARMRTANKGDWTYCRVDVRAKIPYGQGMWPAIWMLPTDWLYGGWPSSGEIDIMEHINSGSQIHGSVHTESYNHRIGTQKTAQIDIPDADDAFHVYSVIWTKDKIEILVDNTKYFTFTNDGNGNYKTWPFDKRFHIILNVAVGGDWPGNPSTDTQFPKEMIIDYVKVYQETE